MVPARNLQLLRDEHGTPPFVARGVDAVTAQPHHMAQEPINQESPKPQQHQVPPQEEEDEQPAVLPPPQPAGTSGSSSGGNSSSNGGGGGGGGDWLRLGLGPSAAASASGTEADLFAAADRGPRQEMLVLPALDMPMPPGAFPRPGIPQASMQIPDGGPRAGPPWQMPPWSPAQQHQQQPFLLPFAHQAQAQRAFYAPGSTASASGFDTIRVVLPPPVPAGVWFVLQAAPHQGREPFLPQIPRSYLRIKDGRMPVRLLIKYLVNKLGLEDESEVEITCRGRPLLPFMTLQHLRDSIWCQRDAVSPLVAPDMSTANHIMVLQYGRRT